jgi:hypothetical protein
VNGTFSNQGTLIADGGETVSLPAGWIPTPEQYGLMELPVLMQVFADSQAFITSSSIKAQRHGLRVLL